MRQKLKGDYLVRSGMFAGAVQEYCQILERRSPGNLGAQFYAGVWNNLGCAYARQFLFRDAAECFSTAWKLVRTKDALRKYVSVLPLFMDEHSYQEKLKDLGADEHLISVIQEYNTKIARSAQEESARRVEEAGGPEELLTELEEDYRRGAN